MVIDLESQGNNAGVTIGVIDRSIWESSAPVIVATQLFNDAWEVRGWELRWSLAKGFGAPLRGHFHFGAVLADLFREIAVLSRAHERF